VGVQIIKQGQGKERVISGSYSILNLLTGQECDMMSVAVGRADDHEESTQTSSDRAYFVLEGRLVVDGQFAGPGDVVFVPKNTSYSFGGTFKAVIVNVPPFRKENESIS
jgi:ethanolamine utilization protein EutQ (cupin superfamily)